MEDWLSHNLITREQALKIMGHEQQKIRRPWILYGFLALGVIVIGLGLISLAAANWANLSDEIKLLWSFLLLFFVAKGIYRARIKERLILFESLLILFMLLILASITLISHIYHTGGEYGQALLLWSAITTPLAMISTYFYIPFFWMGGLCVGIPYALWNTFHFPDIQSHPPLIFMSLPPIFFLLKVLQQRINPERQPARAMNFWIFISLVAALSSAEIDLEYSRIALDLSAFIPAYIFMTLSALWVWTKSQYEKVAKHLLLLAMGIYMVPFHFPLLNIESKVAYAACTLFFLTVMANFYSCLKNKQLFHIFLILIGLRFLILYFQAIGGLAATGWGLVTTGIFIMLMVAGWKKWIAE